MAEYADPRPTYRPTCLAFVLALVLWAGILGCGALCLISLLGGS
jgi:hypothetical protein